MLFAFILFIALLLFSAYMLRRSAPADHGDIPIIDPEGAAKFADID